jgi:[ribosomal protein S5]-alanine N-acetyltransferase
MPRVFVRPPAPEDEDAFLAAMRASQKLHRPWLYAPLTPEAYAAYLGRLDERKQGYLAFRSEDEALVGWLNLNEIARQAFQNAAVSYAAVSGYAGQGYMTEALKLVLREAFVALGLHRVEANIQPGNAASLALAYRCGFVKEGFSPRMLKIGGRWRDHERLAVLKDHWKG